MSVQHLHIQSAVMDTEADAAAHIPNMIRSMRAHLAAEGLQATGYPDLPPKGTLALCEVRDGYRVIVGYQPFFCVGVDDDGEAIYQEGWLARVDVLAQQANQPEAQ